MNSSAFVKSARGQHDEAGLMLRRFGAALAIFTVLAFGWRAAEIRPSALFDAAALASAAAFLRGLFPPDLSPAFLQTVLLATVQTVAIALAGTVFSILIGLPLGILSTATLYRRGVLLDCERRGAGWFLMYAVSHATQALLGLLRAVPDLVWGILFVVAVGLGTKAGVLALAVSYSGMLGRVYAHVFEAVDDRPLEALHASGATRAQIFLRAIWPQAKANLTAYTLYSFECCVRAASVLGFVGAGGIGYEINLSMRLFQYDQVLTLIIAFIVLLTATDFLSRRARRRLRGEVMRAQFRGSAPYQMDETARRRTRAARRWLSKRSSALIIVVLTFWSFYATGFATGSPFDFRLFARIARFVGAMFPPDFDPVFLRSLATPIFQTLGISLIGTTFGIILGVVLAIPATSTLVFPRRDAAGKYGWTNRAARALIYYAARLALSLLRSIPELVWVLICILAVGLGPFAGTLAIGLHTGGVLGKLYAEIIEEVPAQPVEALEATGARPLQVLLWGIWPQARPLILSHTLLRWEMNLRISTILGLVGGGGLGQAIYNNVQLGFYPRMATLVIIIYALVVATDRFSDRLRVRPLAA